MDFNDIYRKALREVTHEEWEEDPNYLEHPEFSKLKASENPDDKAFVEYCRNMFPDSPNGCMVLRFTEAETNEELEELDNKLNEFLASDYFIVAPVSDMKDAKIVPGDEIYDAIGDGKNYCDFYAAHYAHSDGWNETILMSANSRTGRYAIGIFDQDKVKAFVQEAIMENPKLIMNLIGDIEKDGPFLFNDNTGMEDFDS